MKDTYKLLLYWINAIIFIGLFILPAYNDSWYQTALNTHPGLGTLFAILIIIHLIWHKLPSSPEPLPNHQTLGNDNCTFDTLLTFTDFVVAIYTAIYTELTMNTYAWAGLSPVICVPGRNRLRIIL